MSYSTLIPFKAEGGHGEYVEFRNSWGSAARIWEVVQRHLGWSNADWLLKLGRNEDHDSPCKLYERRDIPPDERIALVLTFDRTWIPAASIQRVAAALRAFEVAHPPGKAVSHLPAMADAMEAMVASGYVGVALWATSVSENPWRSYDEERDESTELDHREAGSQSIASLLPDLFGGGGE